MQGHSARFIFEDNTFCFERRESVYPSSAFLGARILLWLESLSLEPLPDNPALRASPPPSLLIAVVTTVATTVFTAIIVALLNSP
jgi:hypothetical protein